MKTRIMALVGALAALLAGPAFSQAGFPSKEVRFINGFPAGGSSDIIGRLLAEQFTKQLGRTVVVDNKAGASGMIAALETAKSPPDGHTILLASMAMMTVLPQMIKTNLDVDKDLTTIGNVAGVYNILVVGKDTPYQNWKDVEKAAKAAPEKVTCATVGSGSSQQLSCALFMALTGTKLTQVPYRGGAPAIIDMTGGRVDMMWGNMPEFMGQIRGGGLRAIGYGADSVAAAPRGAGHLQDRPEGFRDPQLVRPGRSRRHAARAGAALERRARQGARLARAQAEIRRQRP